MNLMQLNLFIINNVTSWRFLDSFRNNSVIDHEVNELTYYIMIVSRLKQLLYIKGEDNNGYPLSLFSINLYIHKLETEMKELHYFIRIWLRKVDDVFVIFDAKKFKIYFMLWVSNRFPSVKFTLETELVSSS